MKTIIKKILIIALLALHGITHAQTRTALTAFDKLSLSSHLNVTLIPDTSCSIEIVSDSDNALRYEIKESELSVYRKNHSASEIKVNIRVTNLSRIIAEGLVTLTTQSEFNCDKLEIISAGTSDLKINAKANDTKLVVAGAGNVKLIGTTNDLSVNLSGAGNYKGKDYIAQNAKVVVSGAGEAKVNVIKKLDATVSGAGEVNYVGKPEDVQVAISGAGSVEPVSTDKTQTKESNDTTKLRWNNKKFLIIDDDDDKKADKKKNTADTTSVKNIWNGLEFGLNGYLTPSRTANMPVGYEFLGLNYGKSFNVNFNFFEKHIKLYKNYIALTTGMGLEYNKYNFNSRTTLFADSVPLKAFNTGIKYRTNALKATYLTVPLFLEFNTNRNQDKSFHFAAGVVFGYKLDSKIKQVHKTSGNKTKMTNEGEYNLNPWKYSAAVRLGYGKFNAFATYALSDLFLSGKGPKLNAFTVGVTLVPF